MNKSYLSTFLYGAVLCLATLLVSCNAQNDKEEVSKQEKSQAQGSEFLYTGKLVSGEEKSQEPQSQLLKQYKESIKSTLALPIPILLLDKDALKNDIAYQAQLIAIKNNQFIRYIKHPKTKQPLRNEIMTVRPVLASDKTSANSKGLSECKVDTCYRVEMYNFFFNLSSVAFVDMSTHKVVAFSQYSDAQPDLNKNLIKIAIEIAKSSDLVKKELGDAKVEPTMAEIKTSLKNSRCERSHHLCVAPTFVVGDKALWAIVDLTDGDLVGTRWTELGTSGPPIEVTERQLENEFVFSQFCEKSTHYTQGDWQFDYQITSSDGLQLTNVTFKNKTVMKSVKLLDWHVSYSTRENFGYSDAIGCPLFSSAVVIAYDGPQTQTIR